MKRQICPACGSLARQKKESKAKGYWYCTSGARLCCYFLAPFIVLPDGRTRNAY